MAKDRKTKNANRRLGDRLWSPEGHEYAREMLPGYYLPGDQLASTVSTRSPRVAVLRDHSPIEWPDPRRIKHLLKELSAEGAVTIDGRLFMPTLWIAPDGAALVLFEEKH